MSESVHPKILYLCGFWMTEYQGAKHIEKKKKQGKVTTYKNYGALAH